MPRAAPLSQTRRSTPKVRTGCVTCKSRRVKCDEGKPTCERCRKLDIICDGYVPIAKKSALKKPSASAPLIPKPSLNFRPILRPPSAALFTSAQDYRYFQSFCEKTALQLDGLVPIDLWNGLVLQACERSPSVRHGIVAIAALDLTSEVFYDRIQPRSQSKGLETDAHHQFALQQYSYAIRHMRSAVSQKDQDLATVLITCLVIICFEAFHGNNKSALSQLGIGLKMIEQAIKSEGNRPKNRASSPAIPSVDEDLIKAFIRLDMQSLYDQGLDTTVFRERFILVDLMSMPVRFHDFKEAGTYRDLLMMQWMLFMDLNVKGAQSTKVPLDPAVLSCQGEPSSFVEQSAYYLEILWRWQAAFEPLLQDWRCLPGEAGFLAAKLLELHSLSIRLNCNSLPINGAPPKRRDSMPLFGRMIALSKTILGNPTDMKNQGVFTFVPQVIIPLYMVGYLCPHSPTRREAAELLLSIRRRECLWDSTMAGKIVQWVIGIEEKYLDGGYMPDNMRMQKLTLAHDLISRTATVKGMMPIYGEAGFKLVEADLEW